jgi:hypothetical protein
MLAKRKKVKILQMKVKNTKKPLIAMMNGFFSTSEEEDIKIICVKFNGIYPMKRIEGNLLKLQKEI